MAESAPYTKTIYCTACSTQTGENKKKVVHENIAILKEDIKPTRKSHKPKPGEEGENTLKIVGYVAVVKCPVKGRSISTFIEKSKAREILGIKAEEEEEYFNKSTKSDELTED